MVTAGSRAARGTTWGGLAFAALLVAAVSGVGLALAFDVQKPYDSVAWLLLTNPAGRVYRNIHYLAAQIFLVLTIVHTWQHLARSTERRLRTGTWVRAVTLLPLAAFLMLSGFILKGDAEGLQAWHIVTSLLGAVPLVGREAAVVLFGPAPDNLHVLYVHHIATATIFTWLFVAEHARGVWPRAVPTVTLSLVTAAAGLFIAPTLHDGFDPLVRGPWFLLGLQELLHWTSRPEWALGAGGLLLAALLALPRLLEERARLVKVALAACAIAYLAVTGFATLFRGENWMMRPAVRASGFRFEPALAGPPLDVIAGRNVPIVLGRREGCLFCHADTKGLSASHRADAVGCASCHRGNPFALDKALAHRGIILVPGNLADAPVTCGVAQCHPGIVERVPRSIMTTMSGIVRTDRAVFGDAGAETHDVHALGRSAADTHLRQLCASCHLGAPKDSPGAITELSRGGGCNACHLKYGDQARADLARYERDRAAGRPGATSFTHPDVSIAIGNDHCFGCHSRSGRISTSYEGWREVEAGGAVSSGPTRLRTLADGRTFQWVGADVHFENGMVCVDCHTSREVMGDGVTHATKSDQVRIACEDCHSAQLRMLRAEATDGEARRIMSLLAARRQAEGPGAQGPRPDRRDELVATRDGREVFVNTRVDAQGVPRLVASTSGRSLDLKRPGAACVQGGGHARLSCISCHSAWAPRCTGCHTWFDRFAPAFDHLAGREVRGAWVEQGTGFQATVPTLGVRRPTSSGLDHETVDTFVPGMILTIDRGRQGARTPDLFRRLYARTFAHTVSKGSRSCESCHNDPVALGYGRGVLEYVRAGSRGQWRFTPAHEPSAHDRLPADAWIGFLEDGRHVGRTVRADVRPFTTEEQKRILTVGACLTCHRGDSRMMRDAVVNFNATLSRATRGCVLPGWH